MKLHMVLAGALGLAAMSASAVDLRPLESVAIQEGGRKKPLATYARETLQKLAGRSTWRADDGRRIEAMEWIARLMWGGESWEEARLIRCGYIPLKQRLGLPASQRWFAFAELSGNAELRKIVDDLAAQRETKLRADWSKLETEASALFDKLGLFQEIAHGHTLRLIPPPGDADGAWLTAAEAEAAHPAHAEAIRSAWKAIGDAWKSGSDAELAGTASRFRELCRSLSPGAYPTDRELGRELTYQRVHPFRLAWMAYLAAFILMAPAARGAGWRGGMYWAALGLFVAGLALQTYGFALRSLIAGRAPVTNMYEVMLFTAFGASLLALVFELLHRSRYFVMAASAVSVLALVLADNLPAVLNPSIQPLVPVLRSNYWLTVHVLTITLGYAAFLLAMGLGHIVIGYYVWRPAARQRIEELTGFNYRTMQIGLFFLVAGTILGGVWANDSWGRFWGWDPKETWALIAILLYLVVLHGRHTGWMGDFALNAASILSFQSIIMAAYGVNFVLGKGLHSYGFGAGGELAVAFYVLAELLLVAVATVRFRSSRVASGSSTRPGAPAAGAGPD
ncbi:MAG TPA: cytochrome c biogenesis protein CcsA [Candidatus Paceibacterota bacterium]|nr:cytochrome c biogenesis protein CcsA [Verrucomicrobiota bacterium]HOX02434.1 cytochrome c biogenesis protein CcsA [Verrucomicrobiota bacterium]HRZ45173.1 cytochrome c biogenesis protein CcsA [Candidatus Paceibacterota bacterium]HRZ91501.1 cytochrome c biogenesis protein CcsA [Candidatus Paceibacterota bacterium]